jgi:hypothetical protein
MSKQRHRRRSQGGTTPETAPQTGSGVAQFSVSEVAQFSMSLDKVEAIAEWYNTEHHQSGIQYVTPNQRHDGQADAICAFRQQIDKENCCLILNPGTTAVVNGHSLKS